VELTLPLFTLAAVFSILKALRFAEQQTDERGAPKARLGFIANELEASMGRMSLNSNGACSRSLSSSDNPLTRPLFEQTTISAMVRRSWRSGWWTAW
jgi:hypothetical protein